MSRQSRESAKEKIDNFIEAFVKDEEDADTANELRDGLHGIADIAFGIWKALEDIANNIAAK
jgi:hypothetical protein